MFPSRVARLLSAVFLSGCAGVMFRLPDPTAKHLQYAEANGFPSSTVEALRHGRKLYISRCSACHELHIPGKYDPAEWPVIVEDMRVNAEIDEGEMREITRYVVAISAAVRDTATPRPMSP